MKNILILFTSIILISCSENAEKVVLNLGTESFVKKVDSIYSIIGNYKTNWHHFKWREKLSQDVEDFRSKIQEVKKTKNYNELTPLIGSKFLINDIALLELENLINNDFEDLIIDYKLHLIQVLTYEKALDNFNYPFKFEKIMPVPLSLNLKDTSLFKVVIAANDQVNGILDSVVLFTDSTRTVISKKENIQGSVYNDKFTMDSIVGKEINGTVYIHNNLINIGFPFRHKLE